MLTRANNADAADAAIENAMNMFSGSGAAAACAAAGLAASAYAAHEMYARFKFIVVSAKMSAKKNKKGEWKKHFDFPVAWQGKTSLEYDRNASGFALLTGARSGITAIDVDDPETPTNKRLMELMSDCNLVAKTKHGFHYVYRYDERIQQTTGDKLDTRNDGGCIFVAPSVARDNEGCEVAGYVWIRKPGPSEELAVLPDAAVEFLASLDRGRYVRGRVPTRPSPEIPAPAPPVAAAVPLAVPLAATGATGADRKADDDDHSILVKVAEALPVKLLDSYDDWIKVGMVLHAEGYTCEQWDAVSRRSAKYAEGVCAKHWASFGKIGCKRRLTAATLWRMLKEESPSVFWELMEHRKGMMQLVQGMNHDSVAQHFCSLQPNQYVWCEELGWYALGDGNVWVHSGKTPTGLKRSIASTMKGAVMELKRAELDAYERNGAMITDQDAHRDRMKKHQATIGLIHAAYKQFGTSEFVNGVISFLPSYYVDPQLEKKMDMSRHLFAFTDGCFDLSACKFRPIEPCDYVSTTTGYEYPKHSDPVIRGHLERLLFSLFEDQETKEYLLKVLAWCLLGKNRWEQYYVFTGSGGNGKGVIVELMKAVFGDYYIGVDITLFTNSVDKRDAPCPVLVEARPKRVMVAEEPESEARLQAGFLKNLSGGSTVRARTLHSGHNVSYVPGFKIFILTNDIPKLTQIDGGSERRLRVVQFPFKFVAPGKVTEAHHRVGDPDVKDKLSGSAEWRDEMCLMLTETYAANKDRDLRLSEPGTVAEATRGYVDANNMLKEWLDTHYEITRRDSDRIGAGTMKQAYMADMRVERMSDQLFKAQMEFNKMNRMRTNAGYVYVGIKRRAALVYSG